MSVYYFFIDDNIWFLRDIARERPSSLFDHAYLAFLKSLHDKYGMKVQLNVFFETHPLSDPLGEKGSFNLSEMPDCYKEEWKANSRWLRLAFHAKAEFPDYPFINVTYDEMKDAFTRVRDEVYRFAGEDTFSYSQMVAHWNCVSYEGCIALADVGVQCLNATHGRVLPFDDDLSGLSDAHRDRLFQNRTESASWVYHHLSPDVNMLRLKGYNHISDEAYTDQMDTIKYYTDEKTGLKFKSTVKFVLDRLQPEKIAALITQDLDKEYIGFGTHEQYFYPKYRFYQPNYTKKIETAVRIVSENGFKSVFYDEIL